MSKTDKAGPKDLRKKARPSIDVEAALGKILPFLSTRFKKSLKMLESLFKLTVDKMDTSLALAILLVLYKNISLVKVEEDAKKVLAIYEAFEKQKYLLAEESEQRVFEVLRMVGLNCMELRLCDDSFEFSKETKTLQVAFTKFTEDVLDKGVYSYKDTYGTKVEESDLGEGQSLQDQ